MPGWCNIAVYTIFYMDSLCSSRFRKRSLALISKLLWIGFAGALGTLARYGLAGFVQRLTPVGFPWGTFVVNVTGCFLFGFIWMLTAERFIIDPQIRVVVLTGFMGAFTTFSTYIFETGQLTRDTEWFSAFGNVAGQTVIGFAALFIGFTIARLL